MGSRSSSCMYNEDWIQFLKQSLVQAYERLKSDTESLTAQQTLKMNKLAVTFLFFMQMPLNLTHSLSDTKLN